MITLLALLAADATHGQSAGVPPPTSTTSFSRSWESSKTGFIYASSYFTAGQVDDPAWEAKRQSDLTRVEICQTGQRIAHRDVRWFPATKVSGQRCAAVIYTVICDIPTHATADTLEQDRQESLLGEMPEEPEKACGEKDWTKTLDQPDTEIQHYLDGQSLLVDRAVCDLRRPELNGRIRILPQSRIGVSATIDRALAARMDEHSQLPRLAFEFGHNPEWIIGAALRAQGKIGAIFPPSHAVKHDRINIRITQAVGLDKDGRPYCVQLTARQGNQVWRRTIERTGADAYAGIGVSPEPKVERPVATLVDDERTLLNSLATAMGLPPVS